MGRPFSFLFVYTGKAEQQQYLIIILNALFAQQLLAGAVAGGSKVA